MQCKKCGYKRTSQDTAPKDQCPSCGAFYAKVEKYLRENPGGEENKEEGVDEVSPETRDTVVSRAFSAALIGAAWLITFIAVIALLAKQLLLASVTIPALAVAIPEVRKRFSLKARAGIIGAVVVGIAFSAAFYNHQEHQEMQQAAQERQERREQIAAERAEFLAKFSEERPGIIETANQDLASGRPAAVLAVAHAWRQFDDPALKSLAGRALEQVSSALAEGNFRVLDGYTESDFPEYAELRTKLEDQRAVATRAEELAACKRDLQCWGDRHTLAVGVRCRGEVEKLASFAHEWTDGWLEPKFSHFRWKDRTRGTVTYVGDKIRFQNAFGAWQPHVYECDYDPEKKTVLGVRAEPGRL